jgi:ELWxxDGT repeat protein
MATIFTAIGTGRGQEIWVSHGTGAATFMLKDVRAGASSSAPLLLGNLLVGGAADANRLLFSANDGTNGNELWVTDGTAAGTVLFKDINAGAAGSFASAWVGLGSNAVFTATDATNGHELWVSDGTATGTVLLADLNPGAGSAAPIHIGPIQVTGVADSTRAMFVLDDGTNGREIWVTDGTVPGTAMLKDINPGAGSANPTPWITVGSQAVFAANNGTHGTEVWVSDGTGIGTTLLLDVAPGAAGSDPEVVGPLLEAGVANSGLLLLSLDNITNGRELWLTDGTPGGTVLFKDLDPGSAGSSPSAWTAVNGRAVFTATTAAAGTELWVSDGTAPGTVLLLDANPGSASAAPEILGRLVVGGVENANTLLVRLDDGTNGAELWTTDGTPGGTVLFKDINPGSGASDAGAWSVVNGRAVFAADDGTNGRELWVSDGSPGGTVLLLDARPGALGSNPTPVGPLMVGGVADPARMLFLMDDGTTGQELWVTDGTPGGTALFQNANEGVGGSFATAGMEVGGALVDLSAAPAGVVFALGATGPANATGSAFADTLGGTAADNQLDGGLGDDVLTGGLGNDILFGGPEFGGGEDIAVFSGTRAESEIRFDLATNLYTVLGPDGADLLKNVNNLQFADRTIPIRGADTLPRHLVNVSFPQPGGGSIDRFMIGSPYPAGGVAGVTDEFIFPTTENINIASTLPNSFIRTGAGNDAVTVFSGRNVIDTFTGSNFITGGSGHDTFFVDGRGGGVTWDTIVDFGIGDEVTLWGYVDGVSADGKDTNSWYASDGTPGFTGLTVHARLAGAGTDINASITFAGMASEARANMFVSTGNVSGNDYLYITRLS